MKPPLYALLIASNHKIRRKILYGEITVTVRNELRDYHTGPAVICCHLVPWAVLVDIVGVRHCILSEIAQKDCVDAGFDTTEELIADLRKAYPGITEDWPVTVIRWQNVRGWLVDHKLAYRSWPHKLYGTIRH